MTREEAAEVAQELADKSNARIYVHSVIDEDGKLFYFPDSRAETTRSRSTMSFDPRPQTHTFAARHASPNKQKGRHR